LKKDISEIFAKVHSFTNKLNAISVKECFLNCYEIYGTVPAHLLWDNKDVTWTNTSTCFKSYIDGNIRAQVPTSWGGTAPETIIAPTVSTEIADVKSTVTELDKKILSIEQQLSGIETELEEI
jgi:hypothetical protein